MIDPFGGSGGFITEYISKINETFKDINWSENIDNINHYDMNEDVVKISGLEIMCLTKTKIKLKETTNSFTFEFEGKKFDDIVSNPPYGGDTFNSKLIKYQTALINEIKKHLKNDKNNEPLKQQKRKLEDEIKQIKDQHSENIVSINNSSQRIKNYAKKHNLIGTCKEVVSMILFMDLLEKNGTACIVMKQGFFFDKSKQYVTLREHLLKNFNISKIHCFEASNQNFRVLENNIKKKKLKNKFKLNNFAAGEKKKIFLLIKQESHLLHQLMSLIKIHNILKKKLKF